MFDPIYGRAILLKKWAPRAGDVFVFNFAPSNKSPDWSHAAMVTGVSHNRALLSYHSKDTRDIPWEQMVRRIDGQEGVGKWSFVILRPKFAAVDVG